MVYAHAEMHVDLRTYNTPGSVIYMYFILLKSAVHVKIV